LLPTGEAQEFAEGANLKINPALSLCLNSEVEMMQAAGDTAILSIEQTKNNLWALVRG